MLQLLEIWMDRVIKMIRYRVIDKVCKALENGEITVYFTEEILHILHKNILKYLDKKYEFREDVIFYIDELLGLILKRHFLNGVNVVGERYDQGYGLIIFCDNRKDIPEVIQLIKEMEENNFGRLVNT